MKKIGFFIAVTYLVFSFSSCEDVFLEKPFGSDLTVDSIFSTEQKAMGAIAQAYAYSLASGITFLSWDDARTYGMTSGTLSHLSGELNSIKFNWEDGWLIQHSGMTADDGSGKVRSDDGYLMNYKAIRQCYLVIENIDKVTDMSQTDKDIVKAEMKTLIAYRYEEMFKRYGGVPVVTGSLSVKDDLKIPRAELKQLLSHIVSLCDEVAESSLPDVWPDKHHGRVTKGVALAIKAETYMFAARPLFNSANPYLDLGDNNQLICFGNEDRDLWQKAIEASLAVLEWANLHAYEIINTGNPLDDYGTAVAVPSNKEVLLAYKNQQTGGGYYSARSQSGGANGMSYDMLKQYYQADGTEQIWPKISAGKVSFSDFTTRINQMEARYKASAMAPGIDAWNNPNDYNNWSCRMVADFSNWEGRTNNEGCGRRVKFWYHAGNRGWFEFPIYRLAEFYLNLAEAYNEYDDPDSALPYLNEIRNRAGLPDITETDKLKLKKLIQREWAIEFYEEGHRFFDVKHWKHEDIANGIIGGPKLGFVYTYISGGMGYYASDYLTYALEERYKGFWASSQYLSPFPVSEINKAYLVQNPGY
ncbi:MAG: RagB/SusD family nutrient uptake outer membrane protein [Candidatus Symbiothrix sp.]|jgi:hypothetical protein|nr:RagB/SusD family nutrient uptake outer membrane protein [Candidatus Symbiothrix sp.]